MIWPMFGICQPDAGGDRAGGGQRLSGQRGPGKYLWVTVLPMLFVAMTTFTAGAEMLSMQINGLVDAVPQSAGACGTAPIVQASVLGGLIVAMLACGTIISSASGCARLEGVERRWAGVRALWSAPVGCC